MKKFIVLAAALAAFGASSAKALVYADGDLLIGFQQGTATNDLIIDLGSATSLIAGTSAQSFIDFGNVSSALAGLGGTGSINWSVTAALGQSVGPNAFTNINGINYLASALFVTESSAPSSMSYNTAQGPNSAIGSLGTNYQLLSAIGGSALLNKAAYVSPSGSASYSTLFPSMAASQVVGPTGSIPVYLLNSTVPGSVVGKKTTLPGDLLPTLLGSFAIDGAGELTFNAASAIPEPSTYAALLGVVTLGIVAIRRRRQASASVEV